MQRGVTQSLHGASENVRTVYILCGLRTHAQYAGRVCYRPAYSFVISWDSEGFTCQAALKSFFIKEAVRRRKLLRQRFKFACGARRPSRPPSYRSTMSFLQFQQEPQKFCLAGAIRFKHLISPGAAYKEPYDKFPATISGATSKYCRISAVHSKPLAPPGAAC